MGEEKSAFFEATFNGSVKFRSRDQRTTSDGGVLLLREAEERLGLIHRLCAELVDPRDQDSIRYTLPELLRQRLFALALGYRVDDDLDRLAHDPAFRIATWDRSGDRVLEERLGSQPTQSRLVDILANEKVNLETVRSALSDWVERHLRAAGDGRGVHRGTLDVDSFPVEVHGSQPGGAYNGYYRTKMYHPLVAGFSPEGDYDSRRVGDGFVHGILRGGNVPSAQGAVRFIRTAVARCSRLARSIDVRFDAAFAEGEVLDALSDDGIRFLGRIRSNAVLENMASPYVVVRPVGRPPKDGREEVIELGTYKAGSWRHAQRVILVIVDKPDRKTGQLELFPRHFFLVTNWSRSQRSGEEILEHYRRRGTFEDRIGEFQGCVRSRMSSPRFAENEVNFLLSLLAFNLVSIVRGELEKASGNGWDLGRVQTSVLKAGAQVAKGARRLLIDVAMAVSPLWDLVLRQLKRWRLPARPTSHSRRRKWVEPPPHAHLSLVLRE